MNLAQATALADLKHGQIVTDRHSTGYAVKTETPDGHIGLYRGDTHLNFWHLYANQNKYTADEPMEVLKIGS